MLGEITLQHWAEAAVLIQTAVVVISAPIVAYQVRLARLTRDDSLRPQVVVDFAFAGMRIDLLVANYGQTAARQVRAVFTPPLTAPDNDRLVEVATMLQHEGIAYLPPGREVRFFIGVGPNVLKAEGQPLRFDVTVSYERDRRHGRREVDPTYELDLGRLRHELRITPPLEKIVDEIKALGERTDRLRQELIVVLDQHDDDPGRA